MERYDVFIEPPKTYDVTLGEFKVSDVLIRTLPKALILDIGHQLLSIRQTEITPYTEAFVNVNDEFSASAKLDSVLAGNYTQVLAELTLKSANPDIINLAYTTASNEQIGISSDELDVIIT